MSRRISILALGLILVVVNANAARGLYAVGKAYQPDTSQLLYIEEHYGDIYNGIVEEVLYLDPEQRQIAVKKMTSAPGVYSPGFVQVDYRNGQLIAAKPAEASTIEVLYRADLKAEQLRDTIEKSENLVIDAGFNTYIIDNWDVLQTGVELNIDFVVPARMSTIGMMINARDCEPDVARCFSVSPRNFLLKFLVDEIELKYSIDTKRLMMFRGLSNISDASGSGQKVQIYYEYPGQQQSQQNFQI